MGRIVALVMVVVAGFPRVGGAVPDFRTEILPILARSCFECHRASYQDETGRTRKPKGGVRLDGRAWIEAGADDEPIIVPGSAAGSRVYALTVLDADDPDRMPKKADPLSAAETALLRDWIDAGADFGDWVGTPGPAAAETPGPSDRTEPSRVATLRHLGEGIEPLQDAARRVLDELPVRVEPVFPDSPLLRVSGRVEFTDADCRTLGQVAEHIAILDLGRTEVTDAALATVAKMRRLVRLDLHETGVGDAGVEALAHLPELRHLNLFGTGVTDAAVAPIAGLANLESVHLWRSGVTGDGVTSLVHARPDVRVSWKLALPPGFGAAAGQGDD